MTCQCMREGDESDEKLPSLFVDFLSLPDFNFSREIPQECLQSLDGASRWDCKVMRHSNFPVGPFEEPGKV